MNTRLWTSVGAAIAVLGGVSFAAGPRRVEAGVGRLDPLLDRWLALGAATPWWLVATIVAAAFAAVSWMGWRERRLRQGQAAPWDHVIILAKQGRSPMTIARITGLPQDVVRIVLAPVAPDSSASRGKSFRPSYPNAAERTNSNGESPAA